ncbi:hypothetical protein O181_022848 [Austropuccinia psidii MF-1]|uniref:Uncharacterized protein n=1 Tax=Austropuccinia psidii MF-1 TaxID=1389203 RepID=A0A9Q3CHQ1_9BASI|nr:hypothetical protein [Austropuccinia psidii MF-1]
MTLPHLYNLILHLCSSHGTLSILLIIKSFCNQDFKLKMPREYDGNSHAQCQIFTTTSPTSNLTPPSYPALSSLTSKRRLIKLPCGADLPTITLPHSMIQTPLLPHQKTSLAFLWD